MQGRSSPGPKYRSEINSFGYELKIAEERKKLALSAREKLGLSSPKQSPKKKRKKKKTEVVIHGELKSSPGPAYYPNVEVLSKIRREPGFKFGTQKRMEKPQSDSPGPAHYSVAEAYEKISKPTRPRTSGSIW